MSIELTLEQRQEIQRGSEQPPRLRDPLTGQDYVLLPADVYERVRYLVEDDFEPRDAYPFVDRVMAEDDANDPHLESYQSGFRTVLSDGQRASYPCGKGRATPDTAAGWAAAKRTNGRFAQATSSGVSALLHSEQDVRPAAACE